MNNGIRSLPRYLEGGPTDPEDEPGASRSLYGYDDVSPRRQRNWEEQNYNTPGREVDRALPAFLQQWGRDIVGAQIRNRLGWIPGAEGLGNLIGSPDITGQDLTREEYEAMQEIASRAIQNPDRRVGDTGNRWAVQYPDYDFSAADPEHSANKAFERVFGGQRIDYDSPDWEHYGGGVRGNQEAIDDLVAAHRGFATVSNIDSPPATQAAAGKGPMLSDDSGLINLSPERYTSLKGIAGLHSRMTDPSASLQQMIGRAAIVRDPDTGNYYTEDKYNWNKGFRSQHEGRQFNPFRREDRKEFREDWGDTQDFYERARVLSEYFGSDSDDVEKFGLEPQGSNVRINLGQLGEDGRWANAGPEFFDQEEEDEGGPSMLAGVRDWLGDLINRGGPDEVQVTEDAQPYDPIAAKIAELTAGLEGEQKADLYDVIGRAPPPMGRPVLGLQRKGIPQ